MARQLADKYGTPLQVLSTTALAARLRDFQTHLPGAVIHYAAKANTHPEVLSCLYRSGGSIEVCTEVEAKAALSAGWRPADLLHTHPVKSRSDLINCYNQGVRCFTYASSSEIPKFAAVGNDISLHIRLAEHSTADLDLSRKFGCPGEQVVPLLQQASRAGLRTTGLAFHLGSQCLSPVAYGNCLRDARKWWNEAERAGFRLDTLDIGGGFPAPTTEDRLTEDMPEYLDQVQEAIEAHFGDLRPGRMDGINLLAEPGRGLIAEAVTAIMSVTGRDRREGVCWYYIDDGVYGTFSGQFYREDLYPVMADRHEERLLEKCILGGPTCDSLDVIEHQGMPKDLGVGELLLSPGVGAYSLVCASPFNGLPLPRLVARA